LYTMDCTINLIIDLSTATHKDNRTHVLSSSEGELQTTAGCSIFCTPGIYTTCS
jgi:hypothetical protein